MWEMKMRVKWNEVVCEKSEESADEKWKVLWLWINEMTRCDNGSNENEVEETAVPGVNKCDVKNEDESNEVMVWY